jgi:hypothetical protein
MFLPWSARESEESVVNGKCCSVDGRQFALYTRVRPVLVDDL